MNSTFLKVWLFSLSLLFGTDLAAQDKKISGTVMSAEETRPLPGVNIIVRGKDRATQTNANGEFSINASQGDVLVFTYIGFTEQELTVGSLSTVELSMKSDAAKLGEVVVVGYGTQSRKNVTSSIAKLDMAVLANAPRSNVGSALQGTLAGLQVVNSTGAPGASPLIVLRGGASINSPGAPLVVIDGVIRPFNDIPSEDIESIEVLKDAASTAIYGARANNGVIIISTKQGKAGTAQVSYKFTGGYNKKTRRL